MSKIFKCFSVKEWIIFVVILGFLGLNAYCNLTLPGNYDMIIKEDSMVSQGQKQLLTIARAMIQNSPMLILDEATSSVDTRTEVLI